MKKKIIHKYSFVAVFFCILLIFAYVLSKPEYTYTAEFLDIINTDKQYLQDSDDLEIFEKNILNELENTSNQDFSQLKKSYYALGYIKYLQNETDISIKYLNKSYSYKVNDTHKNNELNVKILSALSNNYIRIGDLELGEEYFGVAKNLSLKSKDTEFLSDIYFDRVKTMALAAFPIEDLIEKTKYSIDYAETIDDKVRGYLYISTLYKLTNEFEPALQYTVDALELCLDYGDDELILQCAVNLGESYYIQKNYSKTIRIYEDLLSNKLKIDDLNKAIIYGYLAECYARIGDVAFYQKYRDKQIEISTIINSNRSLIWGYTIFAELEVNFGNLDVAKEYLKNANELYNIDNKNVSILIPDALEFTRLKIDFYENHDYNNTLEKYIMLLDELEVRGVKADLNDLIIKEILKISFDEQDYGTFLEYIELASDELSSQSTLTYTYAIFNDIYTLLEERNLKNIRTGFFILIIVVIFCIRELINAINKNKKIVYLNEELKKLNTIDPLTKLYNKGHLNEQLELAYKNQELLTIVMIDIDHFKLYNDNYGHLNGDKVLFEVSKVINEVFKDDLCFRYGGEEFTIKSDKSIENLIPYLDTLMEKLYNENIEHKYSKTSDRITLSVGIASSKITQASDLVTLLENADKKLYESKHKGRNSYSY